MPTPLKGQTPAATYNKLLVIDNSGTNLVSGLDSSLRAVLDGSGAQTPLQLSMSAIALNGQQWPSASGVSGSMLRVSSTSGQLEWHTINAADITAILGYVPANQASGVFTSPITVKAATVDTQVTTVSTTAVTTVYTFSTSTGGTIKFLCQVKESGTNAFHAEELFVVTDSSILDMTGFAIVTTQSPLGAFDVSMSGSNVVLTFQASAQSTKTVTIVATSVIG